MAITLSQIISMPGYEILEHTPGHTILRIPSGFTLNITRMPPFMFSLIEDDALKDPGPFMITVTYMKTLQPPGIEQEIIYKPPEKEPDREQFEKAWIYYQQWQQHEMHRLELRLLRAARKWDLAMLNCIAVVDGPIDVNDDEWLNPLLCMIKAPESTGDRLVTFLKAKVISPESAKQVIRFFMHVEEVNIEGLKQAFDSFWRRVFGNSDI